jgi:non-specific serine/threonine protein kinase
VEEKRLDGLVVPRFFVPDFDGELYGYQKVGAKMIFKNEIDLLLDEVGLGKTFMITAAVKKQKAFPFLFVMPRNVMYTNVVVLRDLFKIDAVVADGTVAERNAILEEEHEAYIVNPEMFRVKRVHPDDGGEPYLEPKYHALFRRHWEFVCIDEFHRLKNPHALASLGFTHLLSGNRVFGMSSTPIENRPEEAWTMLHKLYPQDYPDYAQFCAALQINEVGKDLAAYNPDAMESLRQRIQDRSLRRRKDQVLKDLPEKVYHQRQIILTDKQRAIYNEIANEMRYAQESGEIRSIRGALPQIMRLKQACFSPELFGGPPESAKIDELKDIVAQLVANGEKAIVFSQWKAATRIIQRELNQYNPAYVDGTVSLPKRELEYKRFNGDDDCKLYIGTIDANREGINLGSATYVIFTDKGWVPGRHEQAIGRSAAGGLRGANAEVSHVHIIELMAHDTFEERVEAILARKQNIANRLTERDAGAETDRVTLRDIMSII